MKLQTKLSLVLLVGSLSIYLGSSLLQDQRAVGALRRFSRQNLAAETERHWQWVDALQQAACAPLIEALSAGEMARFQKALAAQGRLPGLQELSLCDRNGRVGYSSDPARKNRELPADLKARLLTSPQISKRRTAESFEVYQPLPASASCIACHADWKPEQIGGVLSARFSAATLNAAEQAWADFEKAHRRAEAMNAGLTAAVLVFALGALIAFVGRFQLTRPLKRAAKALWDQSEQIRMVAGQVAGASQSVAGGASQQAASLQQTSASLEQLSGMTQRNAESAHRANELAKQTHDAADRGVANMQTMRAAMNDIKAGNDDIAKIIKTIDEIAFQTNILALNAAVEAARAGETGLGFAVVADAVRALAQRSAQAAKETAGKIESAIAKTNQGAAISGKVAEALEDIVAKACQLDELAAEVANASREQSQGIAQINMAVGEMDKVTQNNAANAEGSASAAEELNAQAETLRHLVGDLLQLVGGDQRDAGPSAPAPLPKRTGPAAKPRIAPATGTSQRPAATRNRTGTARPLPARESPALRARSEIPLEGDFKDF